MSTFPLVDSASEAPARPVRSAQSMVTTRPTMAVARPTMPASRPTMTTPLPTAAASSELQNAASIEAQLNALLSLSANGVELNSVISDSFRKSIDDKYNKVEAYSYSVLDLMRMQLMSRIALAAGTGQPAPGAIDMLDKVVSILQYIEHRQKGTPRHLEATKAITGPSSDAQGIVNQASARLLKSIDRHDASIKSLEGMARRGSAVRLLR